MTESIYTVKKQSSGRSHFACVTVQVTTAEGGPSVTVGNAAFDWLRDEYGPDAHIWRSDCDYGVGALQGMKYALAHLAKPRDLSGVHVVAMRIYSHPCHGDGDDAAMAACMATWAALEDDGRAKPTIDAGRVRWPEKTEETEPTAGGDGEDRAPQP